MSTVETHPTQRPSSQKCTANHCFEEHEPIQVAKWLKSATNDLAQDETHSEAGGENTNSEAADTELNNSNIIVVDDEDTSTDHSGGEKDKGVDEEPSEKQLSECSMFIILRQLRVLLTIMLRTHAKILGVPHLWVFQT